MGLILFEKWCWENWIYHVQKTQKTKKTKQKNKTERKENEVRSLLYTICESKVNVRTKTIKFRRKHRGKLHDLGFGNDFLDMTPKTQATKEKNLR